MVIKKCREPQKLAKQAEPTPTHTPTPDPTPTPNPTPAPTRTPTPTLIPLNVCAQQAIAALHRDDHEGAARALSAARAGALALLGTELREQPSLRQQGR